MDEVDYDKRLAAYRRLSTETWPELITNKSAAVLLHRLGPLVLTAAAIPVAVRGAAGAEVEVQE